MRCFTVLFYMLVLHMLRVGAEYRATRACGSCCYAPRCACVVVMRSHRFSVSNLGRRGVETQGDGLAAIDLSG